MIDFGCAETLSATYDYQYLGGDNYLYKIDKNISIRGSIEANSSGYNDIWLQISNLKPTEEYEEVIINNCNLGSGKVVSINFEKGNDVTDKNYTASLRFNYSFNLSNTLLSGASLDPEDLDTLVSYGESFNYTRKSRSLYSFERSLDLQMQSGLNGKEPRDVAGIIASGILNNEQVYSCIGYEFPDFYVTSGNKTLQETCDDLNYKYSFQEKFENSFNNPYIWEYTNSMKLGSNGSVTVDENGSVIGNLKEKFGSALSGYNLIKQTSENRAESTYASYSGALASSDLCQSNFTLISQSVNSDECKGYIDYSMSYSNDESFADQNCIHSFSFSSNKSENGNVSVQQQGDIQGRGGSRNEKFQKAHACWSGVSGSINGNILDIYNNKYKQECANKTPYISNRNIKYSEYRGNVSYDYSYSDEFQVAPTQDFKNIKTNNSYNLPVPLVNNFSILNYQEISQPTIQGTVGSVQNSISMIGESNVSLKEYVDFSTPYLAKLPEHVLGPYLEELQYTLTPSSNKFEMRATSKYVRMKEYKDNTAEAR